MLRDRTHERLAGPALAESRPAAHQTGPVHQVETFAVPKGLQVRADLVGGQLFGERYQRVQEERGVVEVRLAGAVRAAAWLPGRAPGLYDMADSGIWPNAARQEAGFVLSTPMTSTGIVAQVRAEDAATSPGLTMGAMGGLKVEITPQRKGKYARFLAKTEGITNYPG